MKKFLIIAPFLSKILSNIVKGKYSSQARKIKRKKGFHWARSMMNCESQKKNGVKGVNKMLCKSTIKRMSLMLFIVALVISFMYKVDFCTPTESWWDSQGYGMFNPVAVTYIYDTNGTLINSTTKADNSTKLISYAQIYINPYSLTHDLLSDTQKIAVLVHELGHVMCLGHSDDIYYPTSAKSIMQKLIDTINFSYPQTHDKNDIASKY